jgi:hypothetical protein
MDGMDIELHRPMLPEGATGRLMLVHEGVSEEEGITWVVDRNSNSSR